jgi:hypothetical protein
VAALTTGSGKIVVATVAVPEHVAVPLLKVAVVGADAYALPIVSGRKLSVVPPAIAFVPVKRTVAVAATPPDGVAKVRVQLLPALPVIDPPDVYVPSGIAFGPIATTARFILGVNDAPVHVRLVLDALMEQSVRD